MTPDEIEFSAMRTILNRADNLAESIGWPGYSRIALMMDIEFVHSDVVKLDIVALANAKAADFNHDVIGIWNHYNRVTGKLEGCFLPRCAKLETATN